MRINVVFDQVAEFETGALGSALQHAIDAVGLEAQFVPIHTRDISARLIADPSDGIVIGHGSPFERPDLVDACIASARGHGVPLVGT